MPADAVAPGFDKPVLGSAGWGIGYIGCGGIARAHAQAAQQLGLRLVACADIVPGAAEAFAREFAIPQWFGDPRGLLDLAAVDVVEVAIPPADRVQVVTDAAAAGKHVHIEKPFAHSYGEAARMVQACRRAGVKLAVSQNTRYYPGARAAYELVRQGALGELFAMQLSMFGNQDRTNTKWYTTIDHFVLIEWGAHHFDILRFWAGRPPARVCCVSRRVPGQNFSSDMLQMSLLDFGEPLLASMTVTDASAADSYDYPMRLEGTGGAIRGSVGGPIEICTGEDRRQWRPVDLTPFRVGPGPIACLLADFLNAVADGGEAPHSGRDNLLTVAGYMAAVRSKDEGGRWVELGEFPPA